MDDVLRYQKVSCATEPDKGACQGGGSGSLNLVHVRFWSRVVSIPKQNFAIFHFSMFHTFFRHVGPHFCAMSPKEIWCDGCVYLLLMLCSYCMFFMLKANVCFHITCAWLFFSMFCYDQMWICCVYTFLCCISAFNVLRGLLLFLHTQEGKYHENVINVYYLRSIE